MLWVALNFCFASVEVIFERQFSNYTVRNYATAA